jgi:hypothetical protein
MTVHDYTHEAPGSPDVADTRPGDYYVSVIEDGRARLACGPFPDDHAAALAAVARVRDAAREAGHRSGTWGAWGTCRLPDRNGPTVNERLR